MRRILPPIRNRLGLPALDHALGVALVALLLLGLSGEVRAALMELALRVGGPPF